MTYRISTIDDYYTYLATLMTPMSIAEECCPPASNEAAPDLFDDEGFARLAKALAHPARIKIIRILARRETCVCGEIVDELPLAQSTVSQHLKQLKEVGLIRGEISGPRTCYCVEPAVLQAFKELAASL